MTDDDFDTILAENNSTMNVSKSFMKDRFSGKIHGTDGNDYDCDYYEVEGWDELNSIFEFLVTNTDVEWSRLIYADDKGMIGNSHDRYNDGSADKYWKSNPTRQKNLSFFDHSHPYASNPSIADIDLFKDFKAKASWLKARIFNKNDFLNPIYYDANSNTNAPVQLMEIIAKPNIR